MITFLFGAGVEAKDNYEMPFGTDYKKRVFEKNERTKKYLNALKEFFGQKTYWGNYKYSRDLINNGKANEETNDQNTIDRYFYTIIDPSRKGAKNFSKVMNYYWICFFVIVDDLLMKTFKNNIKLDEFMTPSKEPDYLKILKNLSEFIKILYDIEDSRDSYYSYIKKKLEKHKIASSVVTTNYYKFAEIVNGEAIYLNGQLNMFEIPELLEVCGASELKKDYLFFPFIFGQSYLKPIVDHSQIEEFYKFNEALKKSEKLIIIGYGINEDDNHINSFLHDYVKEENKELIIVGEKDDGIHKKLKCEKDEYIFCKVNYDVEDSNKQIVNYLFDKYITGKVIDCSFDEYIFEYGG